MSGEELNERLVLMAAMNGAMGTIPQEHHDTDFCGCDGKVGDHWAGHVLDRVHERGYKLVPRQSAPPSPRAAIVADQHTLSGTPRFDGTRIGIDTILGWLTSNVPGAVEEAFPYLPTGWYRLLVALRPFLRREYRQAVKRHEDTHPPEDD